MNEEFSKTNTEVYIESPYVIPAFSNSRKWIFRNLDSMEDIAIE